MVISILLYSAKTWSVTQHDTRRLKTFHMRCLQGILGLNLTVTLYLDPAKMAAILHLFKCSIFLSVCVFLNID